MGLVYFAAPYSAFATLFGVVLRMTKEVSSGALRSRSRLPAVGLGTVLAVAACYLAVPEALDFATLQLSYAILCAQ